MVVHVYHPYRQPEGPNFCLPLNGRCSHICVPAPQLTQNSAKTSCLCPHGLKLDEDSLNCVTDGKLIMTSCKLLSFNLYLYSLSSLFRCFQCYNFIFYCFFCFIQIQLVYSISALNNTVTNYLVYLIAALNNKLFSLFDYSIK